MPILTAQDYGSLYGSNASPAIAQQIQAEGRFVLPPGTFKVQDALPVGALGGHSCGAGREASTLIASNMTGTSVIKQTVAGQYFRHDFSDFGIVGDGTVFDGVTSACDHAIDGTVSAGLQLYESEFRSLRLSAMDSAFKAPVQFNTTLSRIDASSVDGHGIELQGGNTTLLQNCYVHRVGAGKAAYRIRQSATIISCNGVDEVANDCVWGWFGDNTAGSQAIYRTVLIGCNLEDWKSAGIWLEYHGWLRLEHTSILPRNSTTYECSIKALNAGTHYIEIGTGVLLDARAATRTGAAEMISVEGAMRVRSHADADTLPSPWRQYRLLANGGSTILNAEDSVSYAAYLRNELLLNQ